MRCRNEVMSRQLSKLKNLVSDIEEIQRLGRNKASEANREAYRAPMPAIADSFEPELERTEKIIQQMIEPREELVNEPAPVVQLAPAPTAPISEGKVSLELTGNIAVKLKLENSNEVVEVRRVGDHLAISFADGKSVHLPLKSVA